MNDIVIQVENLSKRYRIGHLKKRYNTISDAMKDRMRLARDKLLRKDTDIIWALKDVSFEVKRGEVLGIIGRNGSGKSTLLKILSNITLPTKGYAKVCGRVGSLLEVGTGFHPDLTGRENVYLNGAILGMNNREIQRKFDEILAFAEVEQFIDTPVKYYSSGMRVRLAFAVAAHLEDDILLMDEVLAVGDTAFQDKCLGKMSDVATKQGRTVLFVSHNMAAISRLCERCILLDSGKIIENDETQRVVSKYLRIGALGMPEVRWTADNAPANDVARLVMVRAKNEDDKTLESFDIRRPIGIEIEYLVLKPKIWFAPNIQIINEQGILLFHSGEDSKPGWENAFQVPGLYRSTCWIPGNLMAEGRFTVRVVLAGFYRVRPEKIDCHEAINFNIHDPMEGDSVRGVSTAGAFPGVLRPKLSWSRVVVQKNSV